MQYCLLSLLLWSISEKKPFKEERKGLLGLQFEGIWAGMVAETWSGWSHFVWSGSRQISTVFLPSLVWNPDLGGVGRVLPTFRVPLPSSVILTHPYVSGGFKFHVDNEGELEIDETQNLYLPDCCYSCLALLFWNRVLLCYVAQAALKLTIGTASASRIYNLFFWIHYYFK